MLFVQPSAAKLNLSLRVTGRRENGYHNIVSLFLRLPSAEALLISPTDGQADLVQTQGVEISGENIVSRALGCARDAGFHAPPLDVRVMKTLYPGSGLGAGSGNAAAVLSWLAGDSRRDDLAWRAVALRTGADVPFLFSGLPLARVTGIGEEVEPLEPLRDFSAWVVLPQWSVGTENAYGRLDRRLRGAYPLNEAAARAEADGLHRRLLAGERLGLLPNDFALTLLEDFPKYQELFQVFEQEEGAIAWGITGSGAAAFAIFCGATSPLSVSWPSWVRLLKQAELGPRLD
jgi:4-diphosphocytidyl-2-C-methyl-D-erythritol kinase